MNTPNDAGPSKRPTASTVRSTNGSLKRTLTKTDLAKDIEKELGSSKRPALSSAFSHHITQSSLSRQLLTAQNKIAELEKTISEKDNSITRLEADRRWLSEKEEEARKEKVESEERTEEEKRKLEEELNQLRHRFTELENEHGELQDSYNSLSHNAQSDLNELNTILSEQTAQLNQIGTQANDLNLLAGEQRDKIEELEAELESLRSQQEIAHLNEINPNSGDSPESWIIIRDELHRQARHMTKLEADNAKLSKENGILRMKCENMEILREEKVGLETKLESMEDLRTKVAELGRELGEYRRKEAENASHEPDTPNKTPVSITQQLSALRLTHARLLDEYGQLKATLLQRETESANINVEKEKLLDEVESLKMEVKSVKDTLGTKKRDMAMMEREVGFLKALLASYKLEESANISSDEESKQTISQQRLEQRIHQLESLLEEYKTTINNLEAELEKKGGENVPASGRIQERMKEYISKLEEAEEEKMRLQKALQGSSAEIESQSTKIEELEQTLFELRGEIGGGRHVPPNIRVLTLKDSPAQQWADSRKEILDRLKAENTALLKRLRGVQENGVRSGGGEGGGDIDSEKNKPENLVPMESWVSLNKEMEELNNLVEQKEKRLARLQEVFTAKSQEFRDAIAAIMGLKLAFYPNGQVRVTSQFDLNASFVFQPESRTEGARMQLIGQGDGGPQDLPQLMRYWIEQEMCIPCFLASVTLECYDKMKMEERGKT